MNMYRHRWVLLVGPCLSHTWPQPWDLWLSLKRSSLLFLWNLAHSSPWNKKPKSNVIETNPYFQCALRRTSSKNEYKKSNRIVSKFFIVFHKIFKKFFTFISELYFLISDHEIWSIIYLYVYINIHVYIHILFSLMSLCKHLQSPAAFSLCVHKY